MSFYCFEDGHNLGTEGASDGRDSALAVHIKGKLKNKLHKAGEVDGRRPELR